MAELASPISGGINSARGVLSPRTFGAAQQNSNIETTAAVSNLVGGLSLRLDRITAQIGTLGGSLQTIASSINQNVFLERQKEAIEQERERILAERQLREGQENLVERKVENALVAPVQKAVANTQSSLNRLTSLFTFLLTGWLGGRIVGGIQVISKFNLGKLTELKNVVPKTLGTLGGIFKSISSGLSSVTNSLLRTRALIGVAIVSGLFKKPVEALIEAVKGAFKGSGDKPTSKKPPAPSPKPSAPKPTVSGPGTFSPARSLTNAAKNLLTGPLVQGAVGTAANMAAGVPPGQSAAGAAGGVTALAGISRLPLPVPIKLGLSLLTYDPANKISQSAYKSARDALSGFQLPQVDFSSMGKTLQGMTSSASDATSTVDGKNLVQMVQPPPSLTAEKTKNIGPTPEGTTNVVVTAGSPSQPRYVPSDMNPVANTLPTIASSNPDNFYVYYSLANYNVVV